MCGVEQVLTLLSVLGYLSDAVLVHIYATLVDFRKWLFLCISMFYVSMYVCTCTPVSKHFMHMCVQVHMNVRSHLPWVLLFVFTLIQGLSLELQGLQIESGHCPGSLWVVLTWSPTLTGIADMRPPCPAQYQLLPVILYASCRINPSPIGHLVYSLWLMYCLWAVFLFVFLECVCAWEWNHWVSWFFLKSCFDSGVPVHMCIVNWFYCNPPGGYTALSHCLVVVLIVLFWRQRHTL